MKWAPWRGSHSENPGNTSASVPGFICETCCVLSVCLWMCVCVCVCGSVGGLYPSLRLFGAEGAGRFVNVDQLGQTYSEGGRKRLNALSVHKL